MEEESSYNLIGVLKSLVDAYLAICFRARVTIKRVVDIRRKAIRRLITCRFTILGTRSETLKDLRTFDHMGINYSKWPLLDKDTEQQFDVRAYCDSPNNLLEALLIILQQEISRCLDKPIN